MIVAKPVLRSSVILQDNQEFPLSDVVFSSDL